jgi:hypothetical protein
MNLVCTCTLNHEDDAVRIFPLNLDMYYIVVYFILNEAWSDYNDVKTKPAAKQGRKTTGLVEIAGLP